MSDSSEKFWTIRLEEESHTVQYGRLGTLGQTKTKEFDDRSEAQASYEKLIAEKLKKGYEEQIPPTPAELPLLNSKHLPKLSRLQLRLSNMGDDGCREIVQSGILKQLKWLDLRHGRITDEGARILADCPDLKNLEYLDLARNAIGKPGIQALRKTKVKFQAGNPLSAQELEEEEYLRDGDFE